LSPGLILLNKRAFPIQTHFAKNYRIKGDLI